ncbi:MAG: V-type ATP synthase subunit I [Bacilli bacterium]|nr:V-type ATP synthase subunit I [Bacilli bacterium]MBN2876935.1 V-type ATP synthase subunit I [Bacilli bacterium]
MAIAKLKLFRINANVTDLDDVLEKFVNLHCVHPIKSSEFIDRVHGLTSFVSSNPCNIIYKELQDIEVENNLTIPEQSVDEADETFDKMREYIYSTHERLKKLTQHKKDSEILIKKYKDALVQVKNIENLDISLDDVFSCEYISARVGRLPIDSVEKLKFYRNKPFIFKSFHEEKNYAWCMYLVTNKFEREIDNIFSSLFFERIHIPDFVHGTPESAQSTLAMEIEVAENSLEITEQEIKKIFHENLTHLSHVKGELKLLSKVYDARKYVVGLGDIVSITGYVTSKDVKKLKKQYEEMKTVEIEIMPADSDKRITPPTKLKNNWFTKPFVSFMQMYGLPGYFSIDPTPILAITYSILFGMMFGDLGQGLVLALLGFLIYRKKKIQLAAIAMRIGLVSAFFGLLYGSFFGNETFLTPIFTNWLGFAKKPIEIMDPAFTMTLLLGTVLLGSFLIVTSIVINMRISIKKRDYAEFFFSHNGLAGLLFYLFVVAGIGLNLLNGTQIMIPVTILLFIVLPLLLILFKQPLNRRIHGEKMFPDKIGGFFVEGFFELFEVVLSYVTNTMSFLRVGGFMLSHAGMMLVVYTLVDMSSSIVVQSVILVIGNLFVMGLEGLIVGIQVLRLEFYEMFSRYFEGDGIPFEAFE